jgi:hypothetical protein
MGVAVILKCRAISLTILKKQTMSKSTKPVAAKEPAASKKTTTKAPAPTVKKTVVKKDTATAAPAPDATAKELAEAKVIIAKQEAQMQTAKKAVNNAEKEKADWKQRAEQAEETVKYWIDNTGDRVGKAAEDVAVFGEKVNKQTSRKWVGVVLSVLFLSALVLAVLYRVQRDNTRNGWMDDHKANRDTIYQLRQDNEYLKNKGTIETDKPVSITFPKRSESEEVKKKFWSKLLLTA